MNQIAERTPPGDTGSRWRKSVFWALPACWLVVLYGFVSLPVLITLSIAGPLLLRGGIYLAAGALPHVRDGISYLGAFVVGLCLLAGSVATLSPGLYGSWLTATGPGLSLLDQRSLRVKRAIREGSGAMAGRLVARGLGSDTPIDKFGRPLLFGATEPALLGPLLDAGLDPDAVDGDGRTMLMLTHDAGVAALLLTAGANTEIRDREGRTALFYAVNEGPAFVRLLVDAGADVFAVDHAGISVADVYPAEGPSRAALATGAPGGTLPAPRNLAAADRGRYDWLLPGVASPRSQVTLTPENLQPGDTARVDIHIVNDGQTDRLLEVRAVLNNAAYLVDASHDGGPENPGLARISRDLRWPLLTLPANSEGALWVDIVVRGDAGVGEIGIDVFYRDLGSTEDTVVGVSRSPQGDMPGAASGFLTTLVVTLLVGMSVSYAVQRWLTAKGRSVGTAGLRGAMLGAAVSSITVVLLAAGMVEPWIGMEETQCQVLDRRVRLESMRSSTSTLRGGSTSTSSVYGVPVLAVSYSAAGDSWISTGFNADMSTRNVSELRNYRIGDTVACWFDPDEPVRFTVVRSPGAAAITGLVMALVCTLAFVGIVRMLRRPGG